MVHKVLVAGGDGRMLRLVQLLKKDGFDVQTRGLLPQETEDREAVDVILFPYPFSLKNGQIPSFTGEKLNPEQILSCARKDTLIIAQRGMESYGTFAHYTDAQDFERRNAEISAEATVYEVMQRTEKALMDLRILITGYGLFARALARKLQAFGADIWVAARRIEARKLAREDGMEAVSLQEMDAILGSVDFVLNTVPAQIFTQEHLRRLRPETWLLELASAPYGFSRDEAQTLGLRSALLPGLPAKYAPHSAALALEKAVLSLIEEAKQ